MTRLFAAGATAICTCHAATPPANDNFVSSALIAGPSGSALTYNTLATTEAGEPQHGGLTFSRSLWWSWTAPESGRANFSTYGSGRPLLIAVYTGDTLETLSSVAVVAPVSPAESPLQSAWVNVPVVQGQTYRITVAVPAHSETSPGTFADRVVFGVNKPPTILSDSLARGVKGAAFNYQIQATNGPTQYSAQGLPSGLVLNPLTGAISGTPTGAGSYDPQISATSPGGTATAAIRIEIAGAAASLQPPDFSSGDAVVLGYVGASLSQYYYANRPMSAFSADPLPPGLITTLGSSGSYGTISGTPTQTGTFKTVLRATNAAGAREAIATFQILANPVAPVVTSRAVGYGTIGQSFSYSFSYSGVENDSRPPTYTAGDLPPGLALSGTSISGTPTSAGTYTVPIRATNSGGSTDAVLTIVIRPPADASAPADTPPSVGSASGAIGVSGRAFSYLFAASKSPATYSATGLPAGISIDPSMGRISGNTTKSGTFLATISATNASGTTTIPLTLTFKAQKPLLLTSPAAAMGAVGTSFSYALVAEDSEFSFGDYSSFVSATQFQVGTLPAGLTLRPPSSSSFQTTYAYISGTPTTAGTYRIPVSATAHGITTNATLTIIITSQSVLPPVITSAATAQGNVGSSFSYSLTASNAPTTRTLSSLPPGLSYNATTGYVSGTPTQAGTFELDASATNSIGTGTAKITFTIDSASVLGPSNSNSAASEGFLGESFSGSVYFSNPRSESVSVTASGFPPGLTIPASSTSSYVSISGTPTQAGTFPVTITLQGSDSATEIAKTLVIRPSMDPPTITGDLSADSYVGQSFYYYIYASGGSAFTYTAGSLPPGFSLNENQISGIPTKAGTYEIPLTVSNAAGISRATLVLRIAALPPAPGSSVAASTRAYLNRAFSYTFSASDATTYALAGILPSGVSFNSSSHSLTGTPLQTGTFSVRLTITGPGGSVTVPFTLFVEATLPPPIITSPIAAWWSSYPYSYPPYTSTYSITASNFPTSFSASGLPPGMTSGTSGFGGYLAPGNKTYPVTISATNPSGTATATVALLPFPYYGQNYTFGPAMALGALNAPFAYRFTINGSPSVSGLTATGLPKGLAVTTTGLISGTPTETGTFAVKISSSTYPPYPIEATLTLVIPETPPSPIITSYGLLRGAVGVAFSSILSATNAVSFSAENLPPGLSLDPITGKIAGIPATAGRYTVKASATNGGGTSTSDLILDIATVPAIPTFSSDAAARGYQGISFSYVISATNQPTRYEADGLPAGLVINSSSGNISGTPTTPGSYIVTLRAINAGGTGTAKVTFDITTPNTPVISSANFVEGLVGKAVSYTVSASDSPTSFSAFGLPHGLSLNASTGAIEGIPTTAGSYLAQVSATNAGGTESAWVRFRIFNGKLSWLTSAAGASALVGSPFSLFLSDSEGSYDFQAQAALPPGLFLAGRQISGTPTTSGTFVVPFYILNGHEETEAKLTFDIAATPSAPPVVTAPLTKGLVLGSTNSYALSALNAPTEVTATDLPAGFTFDSSNWSVSGFPDSPGSYPAEISATNAVGTTTAQVTFLAIPPDPSIFTAPATAFGSVGRPVFYPLSLAKDLSASSYYSSNWVSYYPPPTPTLSVRNLPPGLYFDQRQQQIRGTATLAGDYPVELISADVFGNLTSTATVFHIAEASTITSSPLEISSAPLSAAGAVGSPFALDVWPTGLATDISVEGLPLGLSLTRSSGSSNGVPTQFAQLSGQPSAPGVYPVEFTFSNDTETAHATVMILVPESPLPPNLGNSLIARGTLGRSFSFYLWDDLSRSFHNAPATYQIAGLPAGLSFDLATRLIKGIPTEAGRFSVPLSLTNAGGTTSATLTLVIEDIDAGRPLLDGSGGPEFPSPGTNYGLTAGATGYVGQSFAFTLRGRNTITDLSVSGLPDALALVKTGDGTWKIRGTPASTGTVHLLLTATNLQGSTVFPLTLDLRTLDQSTPPPEPDPTPTTAAPGGETAPPDLVLDKPRNIHTTEDHLVIRGRVPQFAPGTRVTVLLDGKWRKIRLNASGGFKLHLVDLAPGRNKISLRVTDSNGRRKTIRLQILRSDKSA